MTQNLKIEVLTGDISIDGMVVTTSKTITFTHSTSNEIKYIRLIS